MRYKNREKPMNCVKNNACGRDPKIKCRDCKSYKIKPFYWIRNFYEKEVSK